MDTADNPHLHCSFCNKSKGDVSILVTCYKAMPKVYICDQCIAVCQTILERHREKQSSAHPRQTPGKQS